MPNLFTVRWPLFARLEAILLFPVVLRLAVEIGMLRRFVDLSLEPTLKPFADLLGISDDVVFWTAAGTAVFVPYFVVLLVVDRVLTIRKGFALLSGFAIAVWAWAGLRLSWLLAEHVPERLLGGTDWLTFAQEVALSVGGVALLLHLWPLWTGLRDDGEVADRLLGGWHDHAYRPGAIGRTRNADDLYYRQTASFREWRAPREQYEGFGSGPRENPAVKILWAITWVGVVAGIGTAWFTWNGYLGRDMGRPAVAPAIASGPPLVPAGKAAAVVPLPVVQAAPPASLANSQVVVPAPMPSVQRPTARSASVETASAISGPNEAVAERGSDGSFAFDAVVNGTHVRMLFDTGASVVGIRMEDALRLGIPVTKLNYSAKIKTANGTAEVAPVMIDTMLIGNITLRNIPGFVAKQGMLQENLLGQTFLARLAGFNVENNLLVLRGH